MCFGHGCCKARHNAKNVSTVILTTNKLLFLGANTSDTLFCYNPPNLRGLSFFDLDDTYCNRTYAVDISKLHATKSGDGSSFGFIVFVVAIAIIGILGYWSHQKGYLSRRNWTEMSEDNINFVNASP